VEACGPCLTLDATAFWASGALCSLSICIPSLEQWRWEASMHTDGIWGVVLPADVRTSVNGNIGTKTGMDVPRRQPPTMTSLLSAKYRQAAQRS